MPYLSSGKSCKLKMGHAYPAGPPPHFQGWGIGGPALTFSLTTFLTPATSHTLRASAVNTLAHV